MIIFFSPIIVDFYLTCIYRDNIIHNKKINVTSNPINRFDCIEFSKYPYKRRYITLHYITHHVPTYRQYGNSWFNYFQNTYNNNIIVSGVIYLPAGGLSLG